MASKLSRKFSAGLLVYLKSYVGFISLSSKTFPLAPEGKSLAMYDATSSDSL
jgi:hypothetical protein